MFILYYYYLNFYYFQLIHFLEGGETKEGGEAKEEEDHVSIIPVERFAIVFTPLSV